MKPVESLKYDMEEHRHRFAVWAAARAAQRGFTSVEKFREALDCSGVREFLKKGQFDSVNEHGFKWHHQKWCRAIKKSLEDAGVKNATFGRAAKMIGVYLKTMVVLGPKHKSALAKVAHPPIDRRLLSNIAREHKGDWMRVPWTKLDEKSYYNLVCQLRTLVPNEPFWMLERYWK